MQLLSFIAATALTCSSLAAAATIRLYDGCDNIHLRNEYYGGLNPRTTLGLFANCPKGSGREHWAGVDNFIANINGQLKYEDIQLGGLVGAQFTKSCDGCVIEARSAWLNCNCRNAAGGWGRSRVDLHYIVDWVTEGGTSRLIYKAPH